MHLRIRSVGVEGFTVPCVEMSLMSVKGYDVCSKLRPASWSDLLAPARMVAVALLFVTFPLHRAMLLQAARL